MPRSTRPRASSTGGAVAFPRGTTSPRASETGVGRYETTIPGVNFFWSKQITQLSLLDAGAAYVARINSVSGHLIVDTYDLSGAAVDPAGFTFVVFK